MNEKKNNSEFYDILILIREQYGSDIIFEPKRLKALLSDLNPRFKEEEKKFMFLINENPSFVRNVYQQQYSSAESIYRKIENSCGFNKEWTNVLTQSLLIITGKLDKYQNTIVEIIDEDEGPLWNNSQLGEQRSTDPYIMGIEYSKTQNYEEALRLLKAAVDQGNLSACVLIGEMYENGIGVQENLIEAYNWYKFAADKGDSEAQFCLGCYYTYGWVVTQDYDEAFRLFRLSASQGNANGENSLGVMYYAGHGVKQDYEEAMKWFLMSAEKGFSVAQSSVAEMYQYGLGVEKNYSKSFMWYLKSAEMGEADAQYEIGNMYYSGNGVDQDYAKAAEWWKKAAEKGESNWYFRIGYMYQYGLGVEKNLDEAMQWYTKPAEKGKAEAQYELGILYQCGLGVPIDYKEAVKWIKLAADQGYAKAQASMGLMYAQGKGVDQNYGESLKWYKMSANQGDLKSMFNIGNMYEMGLGVNADRFEAIKWYKKAAEKGDEKAKDKLLTFDKATSLELEKKKTTDIKSKEKTDVESNINEPASNEPLTRIDINPIVLLVCGLLLGFGLYAIHLFLHNQSVDFFAISLDTWLKQYAVWCLTFVFAALAGRMIMKWKKPKAVKKYTCLGVVIVIIGMLWPILLGEQMITNVSYGGSSFYLIKSGEKIKPNISPLLCNKCFLWEHYTSDSDFLEIKDGNKVFTSEKSKDSFQKGPITASFSSMDDISFTVVVDDTSNKDGYTETLNNDGISINYTMDNMDIQYWDFFFKIKDDNNDVLKLTNFTIDVYSNDGNWHRICDFDGEFTNEDNIFGYCFEKLEQPLYGATKAIITIKYNDDIGKNVVYWGSFYCY